jgi:hypothetical protein
LKGMVQLIKLWIYFIEITSLNLINLRIIKGLHNH